jgi:hypothetical protein
MKAGGALAAAGLALVAVYVWLRRSGGARLPEEVASVLGALTSPKQKFPPGPAYLLLYGGLSLAGLGGLLRAGQAGRLGWLSRPASLLGRHSLTAYLLQFYVYDFGVYYARLPYSALWPLLFGGAVALLWGLLWLWDAHERRPVGPSAGLASARATLSPGP